MSTDILLLGIESSCDETSAAVSCNNRILSNIISSQEVHARYGGVVPELASRAHQKNIVPVVEEALRKAHITKNELQAIAFTKGPGLLGSLLVGSSFAKALALGLGIPLIEINHMQAHVLAHFIHDTGKDNTPPSFPFICLTVSGGHTQLIKVNNYFDMHILGETLDDAAGEAFDKAAKLLGLPYPGGPLIDNFSKSGNPHAFQFPAPAVSGLDFSFSGLKTSFLYFLKDRVAKDAGFIERRKADLCASLQYTIVDILITKLMEASRQTGILNIAVAGGVSANTGLREALLRTAQRSGWKLYIPPPVYCTDNAAMIAVAGYYKFLRKDFVSQSATATARLHF